MDLGKSNVMIIFGSPLTTFKVSNIFWVAQSLPEIRSSLN